MRKPLFQVDGTPEEKKLTYGGLLSLFGIILMLIDTVPSVMIGAVPMCCGSWLCWHAHHLGVENWPKWLVHFLLFLNVVLTGTTVVLFLMVIKVL